MFSLFALSLALAAPPAAPPTTPPTAPGAFTPRPPLDHPTLAESARVASKGSTKGSTSGSGGKKKKQQKQGPHWQTDYYLQPGGGVQVYGQNGQTTTVATVGDDAEVTYAYVNAGLPRWQGYSRVRGQVMASGDSSQGLELRAGSFIGPQWKVLGLTSGLDVFWNRWTYGSQVLDPSLGAEVPVLASADLGKVDVYAGVAAAWLQEESRRVDWEQENLPGFGHEFAYMVGASGRIAGVRVGLNAQYRITAAGPVTSGGLTAGVDSGTLGDILEIFGQGSGGSSGDGGASEGGGRK